MAAVDSQVGVGVHGAPRSPSTVIGSHRLPSTVAAIAGPSMPSPHGRTVHRAFDHGLP